MKKFLIFTTILLITLFAFLDAKKLYEELNNLSYSRTPSQIEIRPLINRDEIKSDNVRFDSTQNQHHENMRNDSNRNHRFQDSIERMNIQKNNRNNKDFQNY